MTGSGGAALALLALLTAGCAARTGPGAAEVPKNLNSLESLAEDGFDMALAGDLDGLEAASDRLGALWPSLKDKAIDAGARETDIAGMDRAIAGLRRSLIDMAERPALARAANAVSLHMEELYGLYRPVFPPAVLTLDFLGREILLDAMTHDYPGATGHTDALMATWKGLRERVVGAGGTKAADYFDGRVAELRVAVEKKDGEALGRLATQVLDDVDILEAVF
jgi:hypothetical protein